MDIVNQIYDAINREYDRKIRKKRLDLVFCKAKKLQFTITLSDKRNYLVVYVPISDLIEEW